MPSLNQIFDSLILAKGEELCETVPADKSRHALAMVAYGVGFQAALELALLDPELARSLIEGIHTQQEHDAPGSSEEFNTTALQFIDISRRVAA
jgi:hypothetical protein